jgi:hypothetical protein
VEADVDLEVDAEHEAARGREREVVLEHGEVADQPLDARARGVRGAGPERGVELGGLGGGHGLAEQQVYVRRGRTQEVRQERREEHHQPGRPCVRAR